MNSESSTNAKAAITAVGSYVPEDVLTNHDLEQMVDTTDEWIRSRTGIVERRIAKNPQHATSYLAIQSAKNLIEKNQIDPTTIDLVLLATSTPDYKVSGTAPVVASAIGATNAFSFDLQAACSGFLYGMSTAAAFINANQYKRILLIGADKMSSIVDYSDRTTCIIFGDGAGAVLFEPSQTPFGFEGAVHGSNGIGSEFLKIQDGGSLNPINQDTYKNKNQYLFQEGKTVFKHAVKNMAASAHQLMETKQMTTADIDFVLPHQANRRIIDATTKQLGVSQEKVLININRYGNTTAATLPLLLADYEQKFSQGDRLLFTAFGGGFTWGSAMLTWNYNTKN